MGIPRLRGLLEPYFQPSTLGCNNQECKDHNASSKLVVIDGPGLAYVIYYRLLAWKSPHLNAIDAQPTYEEICVAVLVFLEVLTSCGLKMYVRLYNEMSSILRRQIVSISISMDFFPLPNVQSGLVGWRAT